MSNTKKISFNMIFADMSNDDELVTLQFNGTNKNYNIGVRKTLNFHEAMKFVRDIVASCSNVETGEFTPEGFDFAVRVNAMIYYAGFTEPNDISKAYHVAYNTELFDGILGIVDRRQFDILVKSAKDRLEYVKQYMIATQSSSINDLISKMNDVMKDGGNVMEALSAGDFKEKIDDLLRVVSAMNEVPAENQGDTSIPDNIVSLPVKELE